jgi:hypothetical protein
MAFRPKPTPEMLARILANYRKTGAVVNAAILSGISQSTFYDWKARGEKAKSGALAEFAEQLTRAREEDIAFNVMRYKQIAHGGIFRLPVHDKDGHLLIDEKTKELVYENVVMLPDRRALADLLRWKAPDRYSGSSSQKQIAQEPPPAPSEACRPLDLRAMFLSVTRRLSEQHGIDYKPAIETTAKPVKPEPEMGG